MEHDKIISRIEKYRKEKCLSKSRLNDLAGFPKSMIYQWYSSSRTPELKSIEALCNVFGISLSEFFYEGEKDEPSLQDKEIIDIFSTLTEEEKMFIVQLAKRLRDLNHPKE